MAAESTGGPGPPPSPHAAEIHRLAPERDEAAASIMAICTARGTPAAGAARLAELRADDAVTLYGMAVGEELVALYALRKTRLSLELAPIVVAQAWRGQGYGKLLVADAMRRAGRWPLVIEADEATWRYFRATGFKPVSMYKHADGSHRYRLAWHQPGAGRTAGSRQTNEPRRAKSGKWDGNT